MKIGLIDVDSHNFPNIPLMKLSAYHKQRGDIVEWYDPLFTGHCDVVYMSKVFSFSNDYPYPIDADKVIRGGSGYCIENYKGKEFYNKQKDKDLPFAIEHIYPDYSLYPDLCKDKAYGRLTLGCPRNCPFCHTGVKDGLISRKVADLSEFWDGQKHIILLDQNLLACKDWKSLLKQLIDSKSYVYFDGGLDIRLMTDEKAYMLNQLKVKEWHFAWDRYQDKEVIIPKFKLFQKYNKLKPNNTIVYTLVNYDTTIEQDLERIYTLREMGYWAYVMIYDKYQLPKGHVLKKMQRWVNSRYIFSKCDKFEEYEKTLKKSKNGQMSIFTDFENV